MTPEEIRALGAAAYRRACAAHGITHLSPATEARIVEAVCLGAPVTPSDAQTARVLALYYGHPCIPQDVTEAV